MENPGSRFLFTGRNRSLDCEINFTLLANPREPIEILQGRDQGGLAQNKTTWCG
ncbi:MAG: hypothetical protein ACRD5R_18340 [Candidatus Acidiferrales bacterium]